MKILAISDIEVPGLSATVKSEECGPIDLIVSCGDLPPEYLTSLRNQLDVPLYYVRGNHDIRYGTTPPVGCVDLHRRRVLFKGLRFMGLEGSRWYNGGPIQYRDHQMRRMIRRMWPGLWFRGGVDVVVAHAPPRHINDAEDRCHRGFKSFVALIERFAPRFFLHGHIHALFSDPTQRVTRVGDTQVINCYAYHIVEVDHV